MKNSILLGLLFTSIYAFSQVGTYIHHPKNNDGTVIKWTLNLNADGTFQYHFLRDLSAVSKVNNEENFRCDGTWKLEGKSIIFSSEEVEIVNTNKEGHQHKSTLNFNGTKARYITKSPRDTSNRIIKTALLFYESETFHIEGLKLFKE